MLITLLYAGVKLTCNYTLKLTIRKFKVEEKVMFFFCVTIETRTNKRWNECSLHDGVSRQSNLG